MIAPLCGCLLQIFNLTICTSRSNRRVDISVVGVFTTVDRFIIQPRDNVALDTGGEGTAGDDRLVVRRRYRYRFLLFVSVKCTICDRDSRKALCCRRHIAILRNALVKRISIYALKCSARDSHLNLLRVPIVAGNRNRRTGLLCTISVCYRRVSILTACLVFSPCNLKNAALYGNSLSSRCVNISIQRPFSKTGCINSNAFGLYDTACRRVYHRHIPFQALYHTVDVQSTIVCFQFTSNIDNHTISATFITANHNRIAIRAFHGHIFIDSKCAIICRTRFL